MMIGKKYLVLAGLLIALGAAVYLNWQFSPSDIATDVIAGEEVGYTEDGYITVSQNSVSQTDAEGQESVEAGKENDFFAEAKKDRETTRGEALSTLEDIITDPSLNESERSAAVNSAAKIAENMEKEAAIETLVKAKGYKDCVVVISDAQVNVIIPSGDDGLKASDAAIIKDIVVGQLNVSPSAIKIIEAK